MPGVFGGVGWWWRADRAVRCDAASSVQAEYFLAVATEHGERLLVGKQVQCLAHRAQVSRVPQPDGGVVTTLARLVAKVRDDTTRRL
jgi:hypothetical protein